MLNPRYTKDVLLAACEVLRNEEAVLLQSILSKQGLIRIRRDVKSMRLKRQFHPLKHSLAKGSSSRLTESVQALNIDGLLEALTGKAFKSELYVFQKGDFSILHDEVPAEKGLVAFLDLSLRWDDSWGGYLGIQDEPTPLVPGGILVAKMKGKRWFVKRITHYAKCPRVLLVLREEKGRHRKAH